MPNVAIVLREEISRLARREIRSHIQGLRKAATQGRRDIAELKRHASKLRSEIARLERHVSQGAPSAISKVNGETVVRFKSQGVRAQRKRLGISAADYAKLIGVTAHTVYKWEHGTARPRKRLLSKLASLRSVGKREALARLDQLAEKSPKRKKKTQ
ncbi:MAG: helix-turn-helix transcriptional regulator [Betaproteobacteria bacterium]|nr:helix-turn-helix transcriptional regulator [Betaproteobacteria bacterium]